jgi:putative ABC transport system permease protein
MNSYLDLIKEYNRVHYKKNRITILCIVIAVSLVNTIFGMADMSVRSQIQSQINNNGNFHVMFKDIDETVAKRIGSRPDVEVAGWIQTISAGKLQGKRLAIAAAQQGISKQMNLFAEQGRFPNGSNEAMLDQQAMEQFSISLDQMIKVNLADGSERDYKIVGVYGDFSNLKANDSHGLFLSYDAGKSIVSENDRSEY